MKRLGSLDAFRALLAWAVVGVHACWIAGIQGHMQHEIGALAVEGFIVLSGYVITALLVQKRENYGVFITRRFFRLFPAFAVVIALSIAVLPLTLGVIHSPIQAGIDGTESAHFWANLLAHVTLLHGMVPDRVLPWSAFAFVVPGWSISLEWQLYLVAPLLIWWLSRSGLAGCLVVLGASVLSLLPPFEPMLGQVWNGAGSFLPQKFFFFFIGTLIYLRDRQGVVLYVFPWQLCRLGEVSYSTYLVHYPILTVTARFVRLEPHALRAVLLFVVAAPLILIASFVMHRYVETPGIALGKRLTSARGRKQIPYGLTES